LITRWRPSAAGRSTGWPSIGTSIAGTFEKMTRGGVFLSGCALPSRISCWTARSASRRSRAMDRQFSGRSCCRVLCPGREAGGGRGEAGLGDLEVVQRHHPVGLVTSVRADIQITPNAGSAALLSRTATRGPNLEPVPLPAVHLRLIHPRTWWCRSELSRPAGVARVSGCKRCLGGSRARQRRLQARAQR